MAINQGAALVATVDGYRAA